MLDLYHISDSTENYADVKQEDYLGSLNLAEHRSLSCVFQNYKHLSLKFFEDTRLYSHQAKLMLEVCKNCQASLIKKGNTGNILYKKLIIMLEIASEKKHGIISFCD